MSLITARHRRMRSYRRRCRLFRVLSRHCRASEAQAAYSTGSVSRSELNDRAVRAHSPSVDRGMRTGREPPTSPGGIVRDLADLVAAGQLFLTIDADPPGGEWQTEQAPLDTRFAITPVRRTCPLRVEGAGAGSAGLVAGFGGSRDDVLAGFEEQPIAAGAADQRIDATGQ